MEVSNDEEVDALTMEDENTIRYSCGYVVKSIRKKIITGRIECLDDQDWYVDSMHECNGDDVEGDTFLSYTKEWIARVDQGSLFRVSDEAFLLFGGMKMALRQTMPTYTRKSTHY